MKENAPKFLIDGDGDHSSHIKPNNFFCISGRKQKFNKRIVTGEVETGTIAVGDPITIFVPGKEGSICDHVFGIEIENKAVDCATRGEQVGIRLKRTTIRELREFNC